MANPYEPPHAPPASEADQTSPNKAKPSSARLIIATSLALSIVMFSSIARGPGSSTFLRIASGPFSYALLAEGHGAIWIDAAAWAVVMLSLIGLGSCIVSPRWYTGLFALLSILAWLGMGLLAER